MTAASATLTVNGEVVEVSDDGLPLIHLLRTDLGLAGTRSGCAIGECGACTVLVDGSPVRSCILPVGEVLGRAVTTPEGLGTPADPHPIQQAFLDAQAGQCGYCVNGMIMTVAGLAGTPTTDQQLCDALDEHLCRCGTHVRLLAAARCALGLDKPHVPEPPQAVSAGGPQEPAPALSGDLPPVVQSHPLVEQWLELAEDGTVLVHAGKVELGQGIRTAFAQIVAAQLELPMSCIEVIATRTGRSPDQRYTAGSFSIEEGGSALAWAGAAARRLLMGRAAARLHVDPARLDVVPGGIGRGDNGATRVSWAELAAIGPLVGLIEERDTPRWDLPPIGEPVARVDLRAKLTGAPAYLHDLVLDGMLFARVVLPPTPDARLVAADLDRARALAGVVDVVVEGRLVIVIAERDDRAARAVQLLHGDLTWEEVPVDVAPDLEAAFRAAPTESFVVHQDDGAEDLLLGSGVLRATYATPYQAHASVAPSAAIARVHDGAVTIWTHSQGIYPLRRELAKLFGYAEDQLTVEHTDGPGCYGMNAADDAAAFAVAAARAVPGRPVRVQLSVEDEFGWEPYGSAMVADLAAALDDRGRLVAWQHHTLTDVHMARPTGAGDRLAVAWLRGDTAGRPWPGPSEGGARNAAPLYDVGSLDVVADHVRGPLRTAPLRCLGAFANLFAAESFIDEMAGLAGQDPVAFRLDHLADERARQVLEIAVDRAGWTAHVGPSGRGMGVALTHYKGSKTYVAHIATVELDSGTGNFRVTKIVTVADAGRVVNPDGLRNQLEGGTLQGLSRTLYERISPGPRGARERDWTAYRTLRFRDVPRLELHLLDRPDHPPLGAGEAATPGVPAAVANALDDAVGIRLRTLPLTAEALQKRLLEMDETESARVLV